MTEENEEIQLEASKSEIPDVSGEAMDILFYCSDIDRAGYHEITKILSASGHRADTLLLILTTAGGDPHAGYRIARALGHYYNHVNCFVHSYCKSAGTLIALGAKQLIISDTGELGPLDVQLNKPDEMFELSSGLDISTAISSLQQESLAAFRDYVTDIKIGGKVSTRLASEVAIQLTRCLIEPIANQIDPMRLGEQQRAMRIALEYGTRLDSKVGNLKPHALRKLIAGYPSHGFVIDRKEASELFNNVRAPNDTELFFLNQILDRLPEKRNGAIITFYQYNSDDPETDSDDDETTIQSQTLSGAGDQDAVTDVVDSEGGE